MIFNRQLAGGVIFLGIQIVFCFQMAYAQTSSIILKANGIAGSISVPYGSSIKLSWTTTNVTLCTASQTSPGYWSGSLAASGTQVTANQYETTTFTITCKSSSGPTISSSVLVTVRDDSNSASVLLTADDIEGSTTIPFNASTTLVWTSNNTIFCSEIYTGSKADYSKPLTSKVEGRLQSKNLRSPQTYFINCEHPLGKVAVGSVLVNVESRPLPTVSLTANDDSGSTTVQLGATTTLSWDSTDTTMGSCILSSFVVATTSTQVISSDQNDLLITNKGKRQIIISSPHLFIIKCNNESGIGTSSVIVAIDDGNKKDHPVSPPDQVIQEPKKKLVVSCVIPTTFIRFGSRDKDTKNDVSKLQVFLRKQNIYRGEPTGYAGKGTINAVMQFQKKMNLSPTGFVGATTLEKIKAIGCKE